MKPRNSIVESITDPTKNFLSFFVVGTLLFTIISDGISELFWDLCGTWLQGRLGIDNPSTLKSIVVVTLIALVLIAIYVTPFARWLKGRLFAAFGLNEPPEVETHANPLTETFPGLIAVMSPTPPDRESPAERAILHHWNQGKTLQGKPHLQHCWLICTPQSQEAAQQLYDKLMDDEPMCQKCQLHYGEHYTIDDPKNSGEPLSLCVPEKSIDDPIYIQNLVDGIYADAFSRYGLDESAIIADFTGGTKPISAGIVLACATAARRLQYISQLGNRELMEIDIAYKLVREKKG